MNSLMTSQRFLARYRLRTTRDFQRVYDRRCSASDALVLVFVEKNTLGYPRIGLSVSRKVGGAVVRNRWKRLLREAFRLARTRLPADIDIVVIPRPGAEPGLQPLMASLERLATQASAKLNRA
jgi:ribonuclease P protein component